MCKGVLPVSLSMHQMRQILMEARRGHQVPGTGATDGCDVCVVCAAPVGAGNQTWVLFKSNQSSSIEPSLQSQRKYL